MARTGRPGFAVLGCGAALLCFNAIAEAAAPSPDAVPSDPGVVAGTQRDLKELSALQRGLIDAKSPSHLLALPSLPAPGANETAPVPPSLKMQQKAADELRRRREARNWLLEAMRKPAPGNAADARHAREEALASMLSGTGPVNENEAPSLDVVSEALRVSDDAAAQDALLRIESPKVDNPLDAFLGAWMTPRDYALLGAGERPSVGPAPATAGGTVRAVDVLTAAPGLPDLAPAARNPYLQAMHLPEDLAVSAGRLDTSAFTPRAPVAPAPRWAAPSSAAAPSLPAGVAAPARSPIDTRYQPPPSVDQKYFPQLKRF